MKLIDLKIGINDLEKYVYVNSYKSKYGKRYKINGKLYFFKEECIECGEPFLCVNPKAKKCKRSCGFSGRNNPFYGKHHSEKTKKKLSEATKKMLERIGHPTKKIEVRRKISESKKGIKHYYYGKRGKDTANWKGGYNSKNIPLYDTYAPQLEWCEKVRRSPKDMNILEVKCAKCNKWFIPKLDTVWNKIQYLKGNEVYTDTRFYCSESCKQTCPLFRKSIKAVIKQDALRAGRLQWLELNREVQPELRQMVLKRDNYICQKCGTADKPLHCHHIFPVVTDPLVSADIDNCITLCEDCHREVHQKEGCRYNDLQIEICI